MNKSLYFMPGDLIIVHEFDRQVLPGVMLWQYQSRSAKLGENTYEIDIGTIGMVIAAGPGPEHPILLMMSPDVIGWCFGWDKYKLKAMNETR